MIDIKGEREDRWWLGYNVVGGLGSLLIISIIGHSLFRSEIIIYLVGSLVGVIFGAIGHHFDLERVGRYKNDER